MPRMLSSYVRLAINKVLPMVPRMSLSCMRFTWVLVRRSVDRGHSMRWVVFHPVSDKRPW
jgi:hypothetical protein